ncbi:MAG: hypothetical protein VZR25_06140, partial [Acutalibacteraceae bacterium]|nr:hypothetical protein [Acutalibacteraceae bacterium]
VFLLCFFVAFIVLHPVGQKVNSQGTFRFGGQKTGKAGFYFFSLKSLAVRYQTPTETQMALSTKIVTTTRK